MTMVSCRRRVGGACDPPHLYRRRRDARLIAAGQGEAARAIASQTRAGLNGMSMLATPKGSNASSTALTSTGSDGVMPLSPPPLIRNGFVVVGASASAVSKLG